jgi:hypothetical protein
VTHLPPPHLRLQVWATQPYCDGNTYVALLNMGEAVGSFELDFSILPSLTSATKATARDLWLHADLGTFVGACRRTAAFLCAPSCILRGAVGCVCV